MLDPNLMPLRVPAGWVVAYNSFADVPIEVNASGGIENWEYYKQDLLWFYHVKFTREGWRELPDSVMLDLGWYLDSDPAGNFGLVALRGDYRNEKTGTIFRYQSTDRYRVRQAIETTLEQVAGDASDEQIRQQIDGIEQTNIESNPSKWQPLRLRVTRGWMILTNRLTTTEPPARPYIQELFAAQTYPVPFQKQGKLREASGQKWVVLHWLPPTKLGRGSDYRLTLHGPTLPAEGLSYSSHRLELIRQTLEEYLSEPRP